jgi:hypothetical protein
LQNKFSASIIAIKTPTLPASPKVVSQVTGKRLTYAEVTGKVVETTL